MKCGGDAKVIGQVRVWTRMTDNKLLQLHISSFQRQVDEKVIVALRLCVVIY